MRIRRKPWARPELAACPFFIDDAAAQKGKWNSVFKKHQPMCLELGCGKGGFAAEIALKNPDVNFLAVDIKSDMLGVARRNIVKLFEENNREVDNLILTAFNVEHIEDMLSPEDKADRIYINFCNPWPRGKHNKRRLTYPLKLEKYKQFLKRAAKFALRRTTCRCLTIRLNTLLKQAMTLFIKLTICITAMLPTIFLRSMR